MRGALEEDHRLQTTDHAGKITDKKPRTSDQGGASAPSSSSLKSVVCSLESDPLCSVHLVCP